MQNVSQDVIRRRTLETARPLYQLAALCPASFDWLDAPDIGMYALSCLLDTWGLGGDDGMLTKDALSRKMASRVADQAAASGAAPDARESRELCLRFVGALLNSRAKTPEFSSRIYDPEARRFETYSFALVVEGEADDNSFYLEPTAHASNLYFQSFLVDVQDEIVGQRHVLDHHIRSGRTDQLAATADGYRRSASRLLGEVRLLRRRGERGVRAVSVDAEVIPLLEQVRATAAESVRFDADIAARLGEQMEIADGAAACHIERALAAIRAARRIFLRTRGEASAMLDRLEAMARDIACTPRPSGTAVPNLAADVAMPFLSLPVCSQGAVDAAFGAFLGAAIPAGLVLDPVTLSEAWVPPEKAPAPDGAFEGTDDVLEPGVLPAGKRFGPAGEVSDEALEFLRANAFQAGGLGGLISRACREGRSDAFVEALALAAGAAFKDQGDARADAVRLSGIRLRASDAPLPPHPTVSGTDILMEECP